jgi:hypothetical protein
MTIRGILNNFSTTLTAGINNSVTTIPVAAVTGIVTELSTSDFVPMTLDDGVNIEIVHVTAVSSLDLTVVRAREGTTAASFATATEIQCRPTKGAVKDSHEWRPVEVLILGADQTNIDFTLTDFPGFDHKVCFHGVTIATDTQDLQFQQMTGAGTVQTTTYYHSGNYMTYLSAANNNPGNNAAQITLMPSSSNSALNTIEGYFEMCNPSNASIRHVATWLFSQQSKWSVGSGIRDSTEAVTGFRFKMASGDFKLGSKFVRYVRSH